MREVKYRAWVEKEKELVDVITIYFEDRTVTLPIQTSVIAEEWWDKTTWNFEDVVLMQSTGLKDKNGREIYEGDIVHAYTAESNGYGKEDYISAEITGVVTFKDISFGLQVGNIFNDLWTNAETFVVEGNIYENPEILEVSNNV